MPDTRYLREWMTITSVITIQIGHNLIFGANTGSIRSTVKRIVDETWLQVEVDPEGMVEAEETAMDAEKPSTKLQSSSSSSRK